MKLEEDAYTNLKGFLTSSHGDDATFGSAKTELQKECLIRRSTGDNPVSNGLSNVFVVGKLLIVQKV